MLFFFLNVPAKERSTQSKSRVWSRGPAVLWSPLGTPRWMVHTSISTKVTVKDVTKQKKNNEGSVSKLDLSHSHQWVSYFFFFAVSICQEIPEFSHIIWDAKMRKLTKTRKFYSWAIQGVRIGGMKGAQTSIHFYYKTEAQTKIKIWFKRRRFQ